MDKIPVSFLIICLHIDETTVTDEGDRAAPSFSNDGESKGRMTVALEGLFKIFSLRCWNDSTWLGLSESAIVMPWQY